MARFRSGHSQPSHEELSAVDSSSSLKPSGMLLNRITGRPGTVSINSLPTQPLETANSGFGVPVTQSGHVMPGQRVVEDVDSGRHGEAPLAFGRTQG